MASPDVTENSIRVFDFYEAIRKIHREGLKVTRQVWNTNGQVYCIYRNAKLQIKLADGKYHDWIINEGDLLGEDWIIVRDH